MQRAHKTLSSEGIAVIAVNVGDDAAAIGEFLAQTPVDFPLPMLPATAMYLTMPSRLEGASKGAGG